MTISWLYTNRASVDVCLSCCLTELIKLTPDIPEEHGIGVAVYGFEGDELFRSIKGFDNCDLSCDMGVVVTCGVADVFCSSSCSFIISSQTSSSTSSPPF